MTKATKCGVYKIRNLVNDKVYIGSSIDVSKRWNDHKRLLNKNKHHSTYLQNSWNKYGEEYFDFEPLVLCNRKERFEKEQYWINYYQSKDPKYGYNVVDVVNTERKDDFKVRQAVAKKQHLSIKYIIFNQKNICQYKVLTREQLLRQGFTASQLSKSLRSNRLKGSFIFTKDYFTGCQLLTKVIGNLHMEYQSNKTYLFNLQGLLVQEFDSIGECAKYLNVTDGAVRKSIKLQTRLNKQYYASNTLEFKIMVKPKRTRVGGRKKRSIVGDGVVYNTVEDASKSLNVPIATVYSRLHSVSTWGYL